MPFMFEKLDVYQKAVDFVRTSIGDAVIATDDQGRVVFMNPVAESLCGWEGHEAAGTH